jgi:glycosyltransferase involved in cell wall biosynthesis
VSHTGEVGGGEEALCDLLAALPADVEPLVAAPHGPLHDRVRELGLPVFELRAADGSLRLHPVHTPRALGRLAASALAIRRLAARLTPDLVHANTIRAGLAAVIAARADAPRPLVHVRDCLPPGPVSSLTYASLARGSAVVVANSNYTAARFGVRPHGAPVRVMYSGPNIRRFDPARVERATARSALGLAPDDELLVVVAQLTPWKGQDHAIRVLARLIRTRPRARLLLVGSAKFVGRDVRHDNRAYVHSLHELADSLGVTGSVDFAGEMSDVPSVLRAADLALVPSWEEPFGRAVAEAMAMEVPVVATAVGGPAELIRDGEDGFLLQPRDVDRWAALAERVLDDAELRTRVGRSARARILRDFTLSAYVDGMLAAYRDVAARGGRPVAQRGPTR